MRVRENAVTFTRIHLRDSLACTRMLRMHMLPSSRFDAMPRFTLKTHRVRPCQQMRISLRPLRMRETPRPIREYLASDHSSTGPNDLCAFAAKRALQP